jgi:hypothetical protein
MGLFLNGDNVKSIEYITPKHWKTLDEELQMLQSFPTIMQPTPIHKGFFWGTMNLDVTLVVVVRPLGASTP